MKAEFTEEALGSLINDNQMADKIKSDLKYMMEHGEEVLNCSTFIIICI